MKKVCVIISSMESGGAEKMTMYVTNSLEKNNFNVSLILFKKKGENLKYINDEINIIDLNSTLGIKGILKLLKVLKQEKPDIVYTSLGPLNAVLSLFLFLFKKTKFIARETNIPSVINTMKKKEKNFYYIIINYLYELTYKNYDTIICQSDDMKKDLIVNYSIPQNKIIKINNLVDINRIEELSNYKDKKIGEYFSTDKVYGIALGRLTEQKGFDLLIEKSKSLKNSNIVIYILGEGEQYKFLNNQIKNYGLENNVKLLGFKENPYLYLKRADFFVLPSRVEGFPNALIEALAVGLPAIVNNCKGGINEIIISEFNGEIIDFEDKNLNLEEIIKKVIKYDKDMIIQNTIDRFSKEKILDQYMEIFNF